MEIQPIRIPANVIRQIPPPVVSTVDAPVTRSITVPVINLPEYEYEYPTIDVPTQEEWEEMVRNYEQQQREQQAPPPEPNRELPTNPPPAAAPPVVDQPTINIGGIEAPLPEVAPLVTAGATAIVTTGVTLVATIAIGRIKDAAEPLLKAVLEGRKKKVKIKAVKPVLHFVAGEEHIDIFEYSGTGTKLLDTTDDIERYLRDQVELDSFYEYDNALIIDDVIKDKFTKEGAKRFKKHFRPAKAIAKKLTAKLSLG